MPNPKQKPNALVLYRKRMGFSQKHVARLLGQRDSSMLSHYEHSRVLPPLDTALALEIILRVPVAFLFPNLHNDLKREIRQDEEAQPGPVQKALL
jgi:transcriptional regulator with XRE-family HTH domain